MLVIRRRPGESVLLSGGIEIVVLESGPGGVKLGFVAPAEVAVLRKEVWLAGQSNLLAADSAQQGSLAGLLRSFRLGDGKPGPPL